jgi:hypothetical protein
MQDVVRIGCGSAYATDRLDWALALADSGLVDYMGFDCLAERTLALAQIRKMANPQTGHDERLERIIETFAPFLARGGRITGNFGAANVDSGLALARATFERLGLAGKRLGVVRGDDVLEQIVASNAELPERGCRVLDVRDSLVSAHAYIGAEPLVELLACGADFLMGGRIADPSLFVGPICHELSWKLDDWDRVGLATAAGHLLECGTQVTGGNFADPTVQPVPRPHHLSFPFAEVSADQIVVGKLPDTGGMVSTRTVKAQLGYEIHDPSAYLTPDVTADFELASAEQVDVDRVRVRGMTGRARPDRLKVLVGIDLGWKGVTEMSYGGPGCVERAALAREIVETRLAPVADQIDEIRFDLIGVSSLYEGRLSTEHPAEVRLRIAARCATETVARTLLQESEYLNFGPAGVGGRTASLSRAIGVTPAMIDRSEVDVRTEVVSV